MLCSCTYLVNTNWKTFFYLVCKIVNVIFDAYARCVCVCFFDFVNANNFFYFIRRRCNNNSHYVNIECLYVGNTLPQNVYRIFREYKKNNNNKRNSGIYIAIPIIYTYCSTFLLVEHSHS